MTNKIESPKPQKTKLVIGSLNIHLALGFGHWDFLEAYGLSFLQNSE